MSEHPANSPRGVALVLNNLLMAIAGYTELFETEPGTPGDEEQLADARARMRTAAAAAGLGPVSTDEATLLGDGAPDEAAAVVRRLWSMGCTCSRCAG